MKALMKKLFLVALILVVSACPVYAGEKKTFKDLDVYALMEKCEHPSIQKTNEWSKAHENLRVSGIGQVIDVRGHGEIVVSLSKMGGKEIYPNRSRRAYVSFPKTKKYEWLMLIDKKHVVFLGHIDHISSCTSAYIKGTYCEGVKLTEGGTFLIDKRVDKRSFSERIPELVSTRDLWSVMDECKDFTSLQHRRWIEKQEKDLVIGVGKVSDVIGYEGGIQD